MPQRKEAYFDILLTLIIFNIQKEYQSMSHKSIYPPHLQHNPEINA